MSSKQWIDFNEIKAQAGIKDVLQKYGFADKLKQKGNELTGQCPIHDQSDYEKNSFSANTERNIWHCFSCGESGNVLDLVMAMEKTSVRKAAMLLQEWFDLSAGHPSAERAKEEGKTKQPQKPQPEQSGDTVNPPLDFKLKNLDSDHEYLHERGLTGEVISEFGLGYCNRGLMKGRIAIPIHNPDGELIAYAGRWPGDPPEGKPKYKLPAKFRKQAVLFNLHRIRLDENRPEVVLVEGFFDVFSLWQTGYQNAVAVMGTALSDQQAELLIETVGAGGRVKLLFDGDDPGIKGVKKARDKLIEQVYVQWIRLEADMQPDELTEGQLKKLLK